MLFGNNNNQSDPEELKRLLIFVAISIFLYFTYDAFVLKPQRIAQEQALQARQEQMSIENAQDIAKGYLEAEKKAEPIDRNEALAQVQRIDIENDEIKGSIALKGGRVDDIAFKTYFKTIEKKENVTLLSPKETEFPRYIDFGWAATENSVAMPDSKTQWRVEGNHKLTPKNPVTLYWDNGQGVRFERELSLDDQYMFTITQKVTNNSGKKLTLHPYGLVAQQGVPSDFAGRYLQHEGPIGYVGDTLHEVKYKTLQKEGPESVDGTKGWAGITDKYWLTALIPPQGQNVKYNFGYKGPVEDKDNIGHYQTDFVGSPLTLEPGQTGQVESHIFTGAKRYVMLGEYEKALNIPKFSLAVNFGWFWFFSIPFFYVLHFLGTTFGNMGVAIILITILVRGSVFPLTNASYKSFAKMKKVGPEVAELRKKYADDKPKLQQGLMELYQKEGVNPMAGCVPMFLQIPIFFALYKVLWITIEIRQAPFVGWIHDLSAPDPTSFANLFGLIDWVPPHVFHVGVWPCLLLCVQLIQRRLNPPPQDKFQRDMMTWFPFIITYAMSRFASGLVIYWTFSALIGVIQQMIIMRSMNVPIYLFNRSPEEKELDAALEGGPDVHPLAEMVEEDVEDTLFGEHDEKPSKPVKPPKPKKSKKKK